MTIFKTLIGFAILTLVTGCVGTAMLLDPSYRGALDASGRVVGFKDSGMPVTNIERTRITATQAYVLPYTARRNPIPETLRFQYTWTPEEVRRIHRARGYRPPTEAEVETLAAAIAQRLGMDHAKAIAFLQAEAASDEYERVVFPSGGISHCAKGTQSRFCPPLQWSRAEQRRLAQAMLDRHRKGCRLGRTNPEEVTRLSSSIRSWPIERMLLVEMICPESAG